MNQPEPVRVLIVTSDWPSPAAPVAGIHVANQVKKLREQGCHVDLYPFSGKKNPANYLRAALQFRRIDLSQYDLVHAHHGQSGIVALAQSRLPVVVTFHGSDVFGIRDFQGNVTLRGRILRQVSRQVALRAQEAIVVSREMLSILPRRNYHWIPAGIDLGLFQPSSREAARQRLGFSPDERLVLFVGQTDRTEKRFWLAEQVVAHVAPEFSARLLVADQVEHSRMPDYMNASDALLVTSSSEGSPLAVREALACNLPVVSTRVGDVPDHIEGIEGCYLCPNGNPSGLVDGLRQALARGGRIQGRERILSLGEDRLILQVIDVYRQALAQRQAPR